MWPRVFAFVGICIIEFVRDRVLCVFSVVTQRSSQQRGGALRDDTKNGCVAD